MIALGVKITKDDSISTRKFNEACKAGFAAVGTLWHQTMLPDHFEEGNWRRYKHEPRSRKYRERKKRLAERGRAIKGGKVDNVLTGAMERTMEQYATVRPYPTRATVRVQAPRYMTLRPRGNGPNKFAELSRTTPDQQKKMERLLQTTVEKHIQG